jgi:hypothetical protein
MLRVFLYENGRKSSFANLSGQELDSIMEAAEGYGNMETDGEADYATIEVPNQDANRLKGTKVRINPRQFGLHQWENVELEFVDPEHMDVDGGRKKRKTRKGGKTRKGKKASKKSRKTRGRK